MRDSLSDRLLRRELQDSAGPSRKVKSIYGDKNWVRDLDIVNELHGHAGCVNALSWSKSGRLLASGSDDQHINIHTYQPDDSNSQFRLATSIATGHQANIFSVKFMPHSNDRTVISAAGDHEVRIFDLEYSGATREASRASAMALNGHSRGMRNNIQDGVRHLSDGDTNCRVYRSHGDRVKRVVTESSPHLFLTCSEDGEVRQWDLRQPSSAYPSPSSRSVSTVSVPPPLISYKRYDLDLNTISCSPSQPHYIALGGAHLHCFLHDRRMIGRDKLHERAASPALSVGQLSDLDDDALGQATQCVRKFAPRGQRIMGQKDNGHITACKISDAHPNEIVVSWSGDHIYSFDLVRSPDASEVARNKVSTPQTNTSNRRARESSERKRKRRAESQVSQSPETSSRVQSRQRTEDSAEREGDVALRVRYNNGQSEDIPIARSTSPVSSLRESVMTDRQRKSYRLAKTVVELRKTMFTLNDQPAAPSNRDPTGHTAEFTSARSLAATILPQMQEITRTWRYSVDPVQEEVLLQRTLRSNRESAWRFVQASGVIARALGGQPHTASQGIFDTPLFTCIDHAPNEGSSLSDRERFGYDFLKAIFLWLDSGVGALINGFTRSSDMARYASRLPVPKDASADAFDECIVPYLLAHSSSSPVCNVDASRFEVDENRIIYQTETDAVRAFVEAVKTPFADLSNEAMEGTSESTQRRSDALIHWGLKVARGILMNAGEGVNFALVDRAFGGHGTGNNPAGREDARLRDRQRQIDTTEEEPTAESMEIVNPSGDQTSEEEEDVITMNDIRAAMGETSDEDEDDDEDDHASEDDEDEDAESSDEEDDHGQDDEGEQEEEEEEDFPRMMYRNAFGRRRKRGEVEREVYCSPHTRVYRGHCNVKTVKDVNFFGLDDEYVVSGSDDGNFFIWDRKSGQLVNILEGDGEVVNVVQGHPYEPMMAISGIDHTIKIFSPDARAREAARLGRGVAAADTSTFSSISWMRRRRQNRAAGATSEPAVDAGADERNAADDDEYVASGGLSSRKRMHLEYQITSQNDVERQGGNQETFLTRSMLASLAQHLRRQRAEGGGAGEDGEGGAVPGGRIVIGDDCVIQ
ncbi:WD40 repeat-like protein [Aureobasidium pullulans]|uniref:WD40 repeat-like protein n=1 Tax=Aureobasidium pullulans TaxID=5580 RepID=A0AB74JB39_AURPU|nr:WD40 repeat-like protein [Aureobasidium pullulans]